MNKKKPTNNNEEPYANLNFMQILVNIGMAIDNDLSDDLRKKKKNISQANAVNKKCHMQHSVGRISYIECECNFAGNDAVNKMKYACSFSADEILNIFLIICYDVVLLTGKIITNACQCLPSQFQMVHQHS